MKLQKIHSLENNLFKRKKIFNYCNTVLTYINYLIYQVPKYICLTTTGSLFARDVKIHWLQ